MSETKTFVVPDNLTGNNDNLATMAMMNGGGMWNNPFMYLVWMYIMRWMVMETRVEIQQYKDSFKLSRIRCKIITIQI